MSSPESHQLTPEEADLIDQREKNDLNAVVDAEKNLRNISNGDVVEPLDILQGEALYEDFKRKTNGIVKVLRTSGDLEEGWELGLYQASQGTVRVGKPGENNTQVLKKLVRLEDLISWNE